MVGILRESRTDLHLENRCPNLSWSECLLERWIDRVVSRSITARGTIFDRPHRRHVLELQIMIDKFLTHILLPFLGILILGVFGLGLYVHINASRNGSIYQDQLLHDISYVLENIQTPTSWTQMSFPLHHLDGIAYLHPVVLARPAISGIVHTWEGRSMLLAGFPNGAVIAGLPLDFYLCPIQESSQVVLPRLHPNTSSPAIDGHTQETLPTRPSTNCWKFSDHTGPTTQHTTSPPTPSDPTDHPTQ